MPKTTVFLKVTSAVAIDGEIAAAGSIVEVGEDLAVNLLQRGKAELATSEDAPAEAAEPEAAEPEADKAEAGDEAPKAPAKSGRK